MNERHVLELQQRSSMIQHVQKQLDQLRVHNLYYTVGNLKDQT